MQLPIRALFRDDSVKDRFKCRIARPVRQSPYKKIITPLRNTPKKLAFLTPKKTLSGTSKTPKKTTHRTPKKMPIKCNLFAKNEFGKRYRTNSDEMKECIPQLCTLTDTQKKKLLWAVSSALNEIGVGNKHKDFRTYGRRLYKQCQVEWFIKDWSNAASGSTSDRMLTLARENASKVAAEVQLAGRNIDIFNQDSSSSCDAFFTVNNTL